MIEDVKLFRLQIPLTTPYKLALGSVRHFDTVLVRMRAHGRTGLGEATILTGYTDETIDQSWALAAELGARLPGLGTADAKRITLEAFAIAPFTVSAFVSALEMTEGHRLLRVEAATGVPILAVVNAMEPAGIEAEIERFLAVGYGTLKIKVGFDADADLERVRLIQRLNRRRARLRLDANQGFNVDDGCRFAAALDPDSIELFEQPCAANDWDAAVAAARVSTVPMMLDESIYGLADIERAAELKAARFVKLKLMKMGGIDRLEEGLRRIRALGMEPVLGNGVATEIGCWMEACIARSTIGNAGEMNGFLKPSTRLLRQPLAEERGAIALKPDFAPVLDDQAVSRVAVGVETFSARRAQAHA